MHPGIFILLAILALFFVFIKNIAGAAIVAFVLLVYFLSPFLRTIVGIPKAVVTGTSSALKGEEEEMDKAKPKPPKGLEFFEKGLSNIGKDLGKAEKAKIQNKKVKPRHKDSFHALGEAAEDFLEGIMKVFRK